MFLTATSAFMNRFYYEKRLSQYLNRTEFKLDHESLYTFGFHYLRKILRFSIDMQSIKLDGNNTEYFNCSDKRLKKL